MRHFLSFEHLSGEDISSIIEIAKLLKDESLHDAIQISYLEKKVLGMIFEKSSTRTRVSFEVGMYQLGGIAMFLSSNELQLGRGESIQDTAKVISSMVDGILLRTFEHSKLEELARYSSVPVINGLTDLCHPVQILADYMTILENRIENPVVAYVGDGNNIANSWILFASKMGIDLRVGTPESYQPPARIRNQAGNTVQFFNSAEEAVKGANVVITDTWISMGQESEKEKRIEIFKPFQVNSDLMRLAQDNAIFLHCLPAYRGFEVTADVIDGKQSRVFQEAENRLHAQKGLLVWLMNRDSFM
jgi:ornithine carbamoyltransferase